MVEERSFQQEEAAMNNRYAMTQPFVLRGKTGPDLFWAISIDESVNRGQPIDREYDLPAFRANGQIHTDQHAMRRGVIMTAAQHRRALRRRHAGAVEVAAIGNGNLGANFGFVAWWNGHLYCLAGENVYRSRYSCVVSWKDGHISIEQIWFVREFEVTGAKELHEEEEEHRLHNQAGTAVGANPGTDPEASGAVAG
jgi:hypothetical protein